MIKLTIKYLLIINKHLLIVRNMEKLRQEKY